MFEKTEGRHMKRLWVDFRFVLLIILLSFEITSTLLSFHTIGPMTIGAIYDSHVFFSHGFTRAANFP